mgnify:CR=1 FL=1
MFIDNKRVIWKLAVVLGVSCSLLGYAVWSTNKSRHGLRGRDADKVLATRESIQHAKVFQIVSFKQFENHNSSVGQQQVVEMIKSTLRGASVHNPAAVDGAAIESLLQTASEFIYYRFIRDDAEDYIAWRLGRGDRFREPESIYGKYQVALDYEFFFEDKLPDDAPVRETFITFFTHQRSLWGEHYTPVGYAIDPESVLVLIEVEDPLIGNQGADLGDPDLNRFWFETTGGSHRSWFTSGTDIRKQLMSGAGMKKYQVGSVGFILEYADGERRTVTVPLVRALEGGKWSIEFLGTTDLDNTGGLIEF